MKKKLAETLNLQKSEQAPWNDPLRPHTWSFYPNISTQTSLDEGEELSSAYEQEHQLQHLGILLLEIFHQVHLVHADQMREALNLNEEPLRFCKTI